MLDRIKIVRPEEIEKKSMEIITRELGEKTWLEPKASIIKRCIHTSADFDYADHLKFSKNSEWIGIEALKNGASIVTDTKMAATGINKRKLAKYHGQVYCYMDLPETAKKAKERGVTRAAVCMEESAGLKGEVIYAIGNAPTALVRLYEMIKEGRIRPALIIGVPVGFVNVVESKELIMSLDIPYIVSEGRKGGSNIAAAICNALLYQADNF